MGIASCGYLQGRSNKETDETTEKERDERRGVVGGGDGGGPPQGNSGYHPLQHCRKERETEEERALERKTERRASARSFSLCSFATSSAVQGPWLFHSFLFLSLSNLRHLSHRMKENTAMTAKVRKRLVAKQRDRAEKGNEMRYHSRSWVLCIAGSFCSCPPLFPAICCFTLFLLISTPNTIERVLF